MHMAPFRTRPQNRVPRPPAMITTYRFLHITCVSSRGQFMQVPAAHGAGLSLPRSDRFKLRISPGIGMCHAPKRCNKSSESPGMFPDQKPAHRRSGIPVACMDAPRGQKMMQPCVLVHSAATPTNCSSSTNLRPVVDARTPNRLFAQLKTERPNQMQPRAKANSQPPNIPRIPRYLRIHEGNVYWRHRFSLPLKRLRQPRELCTDQSPPSQAE